jgi:hypothetical protein
MKKILLMVLLITSSVFAQLKFGEAKGLFMAVGVGPRFPLGEFEDKRGIGAGVDVSFSYSDNELLPFFFYTTIGYQHHPGKLDFYRNSNYSSFACNMLTISPGVRYYFKPLLESVVLLMPVVDVGGHFGYIENMHDFKIDSGKQNFIEDLPRYGFHIGAGFSMFILDVMLYYNHLPSYGYISFDLRANIPIFVKI